jgi:hypothetical protein
MTALRNRFIAWCDRHELLTIYGGLAVAAAIYFLGNWRLG